MVVSHYPKGSVGMSEPSTLREWGVMAGRWGGGGGQQAQDAVEERVCGNYIFVHLMSLCVWFCFGSNDAILNIVKMVRNAWNEGVN